MIRKTLIRLDDLPKFIRATRKLYDSVEFDPITEVETLQDIYDLSGRFYSEKYNDWMIRIDWAGQCFIKTSKNAPESIMGWVVVHKNGH